jgi:2-oxoglutarate ferredoxin oxidoreductase subunit beta
LGSGESDAGSGGAKPWILIQTQAERECEEVDRTNRFRKKGFCFIEILSPCPTLYQRRNKMGEGLDTMKYYRQMSKIRHGAPTTECALSKTGEIVVGRFVDRERPEYLELQRAQMLCLLGERYTEFEGSSRL